MKRFLIISLKYSPGLFKEIKLLESSLFQHGTTHFLLSNYYIFPANTSKTVSYLTKGSSTKEMIIDFLLLPFKFFRHIKTIEKNNSAIIYNPHPANFLIQLLLKIYSTKTYVVLHEPFKNKMERKNFGTIMAIYFQIVNIFQKISIKLSDGIITMSPYGSELFKGTIGKNYIKPIICSNLLFNNEETIEKHSRKWISLIGQMNNNKGIIEFINLINYCLKNGIYDHHFVIITSSPIQNYTKNLDEGYSKILKIVNKVNITDDEITAVIRNSKAVCILHQSGTQSGVLPQAAKYGIPIIIRDIPAFTQYFENNGIKLPFSFSNEDFLKAIDSVNKNFQEFSQSNNLVFKKYFSVDNFDKLYKAIL